MSHGQEPHVSVFVMVCCSLFLSTAIATIPTGNVTAAAVFAGKRWYTITTDHQTARLIVRRSDIGGPVTRMTNVLPTPPGSFPRGVTVINRAPDIINIFGIGADQYLYHGVIDYDIWLYVDEDDSPKFNNLSVANNVKWDLTKGVSAGFEDTTHVWVLATNELHKIHRRKWVGRWFEWEMANFSALPPGTSTPTQYRQDKHVWFSVSSDTPFRYSTELSPLRIMKGSVSEGAPLSSFNAWYAGLLYPGVATIRRGHDALDIFGIGKDLYLYHGYIHNEVWGPTTADGGPTWENLGGQWDPAFGVTSGSHDDDIWVVATEKATGIPLMTTWSASARYNGLLVLHLNCTNPQAPRNDLNYFVPPTSCREADTLVQACYTSWDQCKTKGTRCSNLDVCLRSLFVCLDHVLDVSPLGSNVSSPCYSWKESLSNIKTYLDMGGAYSGSGLQAGCRYAACIYMAGAPKLNSNSVCPVSTATCSSAPKPPPKFILSFGGIWVDFSEVKAAQIRSAMTQGISIFVDVPEHAIYIVSIDEAAGSFTIIILDPTVDGNAVSELLRKGVGNNNATAAAFGELKAVVGFDISFVNVAMGEGSSVTFAPPTQTPVPTTASSKAPPAVFPAVIAAVLVAGLLLL